LARHPLCLVLFCYSISRSFISRTGLPEKTKGFSERVELVYNSCRFPDSFSSPLLLGVNNLIKGTVRSIDPVSHELSIAFPSGFDLKINRTDMPISEFHIGDPVVVSIRGAAVNVFNNPPAGAYNIFRGSIEKAIFLGDFFDYEVKVGELTLSSRCGANQRFELHEQVYVSFPSEAPGVCCFKE
jgi:hypothetical protein